MNARHAKEKKRKTTGRAPHMGNCNRQRKGVLRTDRDQMNARHAKTKRKRKRRRAQEEKTKANATEDRTPTDTYWCTSDRNQKHLQEEAGTGPRTTADRERRLLLHAR